jgi:hypothetical protein
LPDVHLADPGVRNYRNGLVLIARRWNFDHLVDVLIDFDHAKRGAVCRVNLGEAVSLIFGDFRRGHLPAGPGEIEGDIGEAGSL